MKKIICLMLAVLLMATCFAGCKKDADKDSNLSTDAIVEVFEKPENYASVVVVTINPQFRLYLDAQNNVLAVEPVNADAKDISEKITFENKKVDAVVNDIVVAANDGGFIKEDATIDIKVSEVVDNTVVAETLLEQVKTATEQKVEELKIKVEVIVTVEAVNNQTESTSSQDTSSKNEPVKTECKHTKIKVVSANTGKNIIDSSKLDVFYHIKKCELCGKTVATEKHNVSGNKCTICGQSNFAIATKDCIDAEVADDNDFGGAKIKADGSLDYSLVIESCWWDADGEYLDMWHVKISEANMLKAIREKFVFSDADFAKLKQQKTYNCSLGTQTYENGYFNCADPAAGGPSDYSHTVIGYKDNKNGTFTVYYNYLKGGPDVEENERTHLYYYAVEYTYSGASNLSLVYDEYRYVISGFKPVVESLRVKSIKKVSDISSITKIK